MSLHELTAKAFASNLASEKWIRLCTLWASRNAASLTLDESIGTLLIGSIIALLQNNPADPRLRQYLMYAIQNNIISNSTYIATMLSIVVVQSINDCLSIEMLCRVALDAYQANSTPLFSDKTPRHAADSLSEVVHDMLSLLQEFSKGCMSTQRLQLLSTASNLGILLLSSMNDISRLSMAQAATHYHLAESLRMNLHISPELHQFLQNYTLSLGMLIGTLDRPVMDTRTPGSKRYSEEEHHMTKNPSDAARMSMNWYLTQLVMNRAQKCGAGDSLAAVASLLAIYRSYTWTLADLLEQILTAAFTSIASCQSHEVGYWKAFVVGRLPRLLVGFEQASELDGWNTAMEVALRALFSKEGLLNRCEAVLRYDVSPSSSSGTPTTRFPILRQFLSELNEKELISRNRFTDSLLDSADITIGKESDTIAPEISKALLRSHLTSATSFQDLLKFSERVSDDPRVHEGLAELINPLFKATSPDLVLLSNVSRLLYMNLSILDILSLHIDMARFVSDAIDFIDDFDGDIAGDPQTALGLLGHVTLFVQTTLVKYQLSGRMFAGRADLFTLEYYTSPSRLVTTQSDALLVWYKALFKSSDGLEDTLVRSTKPRDILIIAPLIVARAIKGMVGAQEDRIDRDALINGVSYFVSPQLNWCLLGVVTLLMNEMSTRSAPMPIYIEVLQILLLHENCPRPVLKLCGHMILRLMPIPSTPARTATAVAAERMRNIAMDAVGVKAPTEASTPPTRTPPRDYVQQMIREYVMAMAGDGQGRLPYIDMRRCFYAVTPYLFLELAWRELFQASKIWETTLCVRIGTLILLNDQLPTPGPSLVHVFLRVTARSILLYRNQETPQDQTLLISFMAAVISSTLHHGYQLEAASARVGIQRDTSVPSILDLANSFATALKDDMSTSPESRLLLERFGQSVDFIAEWPMFKLQIKD